MSFSADWLELRADADRRARNPDLAADLAVAMFERDPLRVLDLGSGTGANLAALSPILGAVQHWTLVDNDAALLETVAPPPGITVERRVADLASGLEALFAPAPDLVTASAFFDLAGQAMIDEVVARTVRAGAAFYTVLTYDGRQVWAPGHAGDAGMLAAFNADQRRDKGLGPALGPDATDALARAFEQAGYEVHTAPSDWALAPREDAALIRELAMGTARALAPAVGTAAAEDWRTARVTADEVMIGHLDLLALPPGIG